MYKKLYRCTGLKAPWKLKKKRDLSSNRMSTRVITKKKKKKKPPQKKKKKKEIKLSPTKQQFSCYNPIKTSLLAVAVAPVPFPF